MTTYENQTFEQGDLFLKMFAECTFTNCTFNGEARRCNFFKAVFTNCTFEEGFKFADCNVSATSGINENLVQGGNYSTLEEYNQEQDILMKLGLLNPIP